MSWLMQDADHRRHDCAARDETMSPSANCRRARVRRAAERLVVELRSTPRRKLRVVGPPVAAARENASLPPTLCQTVGDPQPQPSVLSSSAFSIASGEHAAKSLDHETLLRA